MFQLDPFTAEELAELLVHPGDIHVHPRGIDHQQVFLVGQVINKQVINHPAAFVAHQGVLALADSNSLQVGGEELIQKSRAFGPRMRT